MEIIIAVIKFERERDREKKKQKFAFYIYRLRDIESKYHRFRLHSRLNNTYGPTGDVCKYV